MGVRFEDGQRLACAPDILSRILDGEAVLLDLASGTYFGLNPVGSRVWELISASKTVGEIRVVIQRLRGSGRLRPMKCSSPRPRRPSSTR